jgi:hypothetical protein
VTRRGGRTPGFHRPAVPVVPLRRSGRRGRTPTSGRSGCPAPRCAGRAARCRARRPRRRSGWTTVDRPPDHLMGSSVRLRRPPAAVSTPAGTRGRSARPDRHRTRSRTRSGSACARGSPPRSPAPPGTASPRETPIPRAARTLSSTGSSSAHRCAPTVSASWSGRVVRQHAAPGRGGVHGEGVAHAPIRGCAVRVLRADLDGGLSGSGVVAGVAGGDREVGGRRARRGRGRVLRCGLVAGGGVGAASAGGGATGRGARSATAIRRGGRGGVRACFLRAPVPAGG